MHEVETYEFKKHDYYPILPLVYDDALSYLETLGRYCAKLNEVITALNSATSDAVEQSKAYTNEKIAEQNEFIENAVRQIEDLGVEIRNANDEFIRTINARLTITDSKLDSFDNRLTATVSEINARTDRAIQQNNDYLLSNMERELANIKVLNFFTGQYIGVQSMFDYLAQLHTDNSITVETLVSRNKTVDELITLNLQMTLIVLDGINLIV